MFPNGCEEKRRKEKEKKETYLPIIEILHAHDHSLQQWYILLFQDAFPVFTRNTRKDRTDVRVVHPANKVGPMGVEVF